MKKRWIGGLAGLVLAFILTGCGATGQVESLSPEEMKEYIEQNNSAYVLINSTEDEEEREAYIKLVEENTDSINVKEINSQSAEMLDNNLTVEDLGLGGPSVFYSLSYYEGGKLQNRISLSEQEYDSLEDREKAIQKFIEDTKS